MNEVRVKKTFEYMDENKDYIGTDELLIEYFSGNSEVAKELMHRMEESEAERECVRRGVEVWFSSGVAMDDAAYDADRAYERFLNKIRKSAGMTLRPRMVKRSTTHIWLRVAAVVLIVILPLVAYLGGKETVKSTFSDVVVETPLGAKTKLYLPDGTQVWLNAGSKIIYSQGFGVDDRNLQLEGEGYFEVTKDTKKPFRIHTKELDLRVVGTKFNFRNYSEDKEVVVSLMEGEVALHNGLKNMSELFLNPQEKVVLDKQTGNMTKMTAKTENANAWSRNELLFDEELLEDIAKELSRTYDVRVKVADSLRTVRFYGVFSTIGTVEEVLNAMAATQRMRYQRVDNEYIIY